MRTLVLDLKISARRLFRSPGYSLTAILTLALGIGSVTSMFSVVDSVLLKPFAFEHPDRLVVLRETNRSHADALLPDNYVHYLNWKANAKSLEDAAIFRNHGGSISLGTDHPETVGGLAISANFLPVLGIQPILGRNFLPAEMTSGRNGVVILSWDAWQRYFQGNQSAIGSVLHIGGTPYTVVGVLPRSFRFPHVSEMATAVPQQVIRPYDIFSPLAPDMSPSGNYNYLVVARQRSGATMAETSNELKNLEENLARNDPRMPRDASVLVEPLKQEFVGRVSTALWVLLAAVAAVLLIGCVNLANLQLARAVKRQQEFAVRAALGANSLEQIQSAMTDSLILAAIGGLAGIGLSFFTVRSLIAFAPASLPRIGESGVNLPVMAVAGGLSIVTAVLFGLLPAWRSMRTSPQTTMQAASGRMINSRGGRRTHELLIAGQIACTVPLLIVAGLLLRSFSRMLTQDRGFDSSHVVMAYVDMAAPRFYGSAEYSALAHREFIDRALEALTQLPGVQSVAMTSEEPMGGDTWVSWILRREHPVRAGEEPTANMRWVSPSYVSTLKIPLLEGRDLQMSDREHSTNVLISQEAARKAWPGEDPLGKKFTTGGDTTYTVVGMVADARINDLKDVASTIYIPYWQNPWWRAIFFVRSSQRASTLEDSIRQTIWKIDPEVPIPTLKTLDDQVSGSVATERFETMLLAGFGVTALALAILGIYGILAYTVSLREREFGIRLALGSSKNALMRLILGEVSIPVLGGTAVGLLMSFAATRLMMSIFYDAQGGVPIVAIASIGILLTIALLVASLPARRAATVDPMEVLRSE